VDGTEASPTYSQAVECVLTVVGKSSLHRPLLPGWRTVTKLHVDFYTSGNQTQDLQVVGGSFAGAVDAGLSISTLAADALDADGASQYIFDVERSDAEAFMADEISERVGVPRTHRSEYRITHRFLSHRFAPTRHG